MKKATEQRKKEKIVFNEKFSPPLIADEMRAFFSLKVRHNYFSYGVIFFSTLL